MAECMPHTRQHPSLRPDGWLSREEAAVHARVSISMIDRAIATDELRSIKVGRRRLTHEDWLDEWLRHWGDAP
jgi:excisionase family DNA binding protein